MGKNKLTAYKKQDIFLGYTTYIPIGTHLKKIQYMKITRFTTFFLLVGSASLLLSGCASRTHAVTHTANSQKQTRSTDSLDIRRRRLVVPAMLPGSQARLSLPLDSLRQLPPGAIYLRQSGRATLAARYQRDTLYLYAACDSLQALAYEYEEEIRRLRTHTADERNERAEETEKKVGPAPWRISPIWLLAAFACGAWGAGRKKK